MGLGHPCKFQQVSCLGFVAAPRLLSRGQPTLLNVSPSSGLVHYIQFRQLLSPNGILLGVKFTLRPTLAFSYIGSITAQPLSNERQPNCGIQQRVSPIFGTVAIGLHRSTF